MTRRNSLEIKVEILRVAVGGAKKTHIVHGANLNFTIVKKYLSELMESGLLSVHSGSVIYKTTEKGLDFLRKYNNLRTLMEPSTFPDDRNIS